MCGHHTGATGLIEDRKPGWALGLWSAPETGQEDLMDRAGHVLLCGAGTPTVWGRRACRMRPSEGPEVRELEGEMGWQRGSEGTEASLLKICPDSHYEIAALMLGAGGADQQG